MEHYFLLRCDEDGDDSLEEIDAEELLTRLNDEYYGSKTFASAVPKSLESFVGLILIKGKIIVPKAIEVVKKYTVE